MTTKQINFFISPDDLPDIAQFISKRNCIIFKRDSNTPEVQGVYDIVRNDDEVFQVYISNRENFDDLYFERLDTKETFYIDIIKSYCIEFSIGGFYPYSKNEFHISRFYYILSYFDGGRIVEKSKEFTKAADSLLNDFKKEFLIRNTQFSKDFVSKRFVDWVQENQARKTIDGTKFLI